MFKNLFLPLIAVALFITVVGLIAQGKIGNLKTPSNTNKPQASSMPTSQKIIIGSKTIYVSVADTPAKRAKGLSGIDALGNENGMIFVFSPPSKPNFWMKDTRIALDMIWIKDGKVIDITKNVQPEPGVADQDLKLYPAPSDVDYVLEVNGGYSDQNNIKVSDSVDVNL